MSRHDIQEEQKETEGDPRVKARLRQIRTIRARRRMLAAVPKATVVITNPTHYAVALAYDRAKHAAPRVVAKGVDSLAARIREAAEANRVPVVANPPLARALYRVEMDADIPAEHYQAVAEIIAYVWRLGDRGPQGGVIVRSASGLRAGSGSRWACIADMVRCSDSCMFVDVSGRSGITVLRTNRGARCNSVCKILTRDRGNCHRRLHALQHTRQNEEPLMEKNKALDAAVAQIERAFGKGSIMRMGARGIDEHIEVIPSGSLGLDLALGIGGLPRGRVIEIYGPESSGKTTLALHAIAEAQKRGGTCAFIDAEHALDPGYARKLGVDVDNLLISQPDAGEQALEICDTLVRSGAIDVVVIDSVAALVPRAELEGEMGDSHMGLHARLMSQALRKLTGSVSRSNTMLIFLNQIRMKIGVMFGNPETTTGGNALKFYASLRLEIRRIGQIKDRDEVVGNQTRVKVVKNKLAPPFRQVEFDIMYGEGISKVGELIDLGVKAGVVEKSGAWFSYDSQRIGQGRENAKQFLRDHQRRGGRDRAARPRPVRRGGEHHAGDARRDRGGGSGGMMPVGDAGGCHRVGWVEQSETHRYTVADHVASPAVRRRSRPDRRGARCACAALPTVLAHGGGSHPRTGRAHLDRPASRRHGGAAVDLRRGGGARPRGAGGRRRDRYRGRRASPEARRGRSRTRGGAAVWRLPRDVHRSLS